MLITLKLHGIFGSNFVDLCILTLSSHWYGKSQVASPRNILPGRALLVKMLIILEPHGIFGSNFVYLRILTLFSHWYEKGDVASPSIILADRVTSMKKG